VSTEERLQTITGLLADILGVLEQIDEKFDELLDSLDRCTG
jgi:hypothetical protein